MSKVSSDLEELIAFREHLITFNRTLTEQYSSMSSNWRSLGDVWTDQKYYEFGKALDDVAKGIDRYIAATDGHEEHLLRLIERLKAYLDTRV